MRRKEKLENDFFDNHRDTDLNVVSYYIKNAKFLNLLCNKKSAGAHANGQIVLQRCILSKR